MRRLLGLLTLCLATPALAQSPDEPEVWARLPEPVTNNAVAGVELDGRLMAYSFAGLHAGKTWRDVTADAYACDLDARECREIDGLPDGIGRLASVAVTVRGQIYIFGGYTVAEDGSERSTPEVWRFDPASETYTHITDMPVPVDDTVALPFRDRYIYLVSGWHDTDNVDNVQVYDVEDDRWFEATPFPGAPVFGHAAGTWLDVLLVCGGTRVVPATEPNGRRQFVLSEACWSGQLHGNAPAVIRWTEMPNHMSAARYRAAGSIASSGGEIWFLGGTNNPYNYNGLGYDGVPSEPAGDWSAFFIEVGDMTPFWETGPHSPRTMDHRGAIELPASLIESDCALAHYVTLGGMVSGQRVTDAVAVHALPSTCPTN